MDLFSRKIVGWAMEARLKSVLVLNPLQLALQNCKPPASLLHHSDQGSQYASETDQSLLAAGEHPGQYE